MKILFLGDYSNLHACLASELRRLGHYVTVVSDGGAYQQTRTDILLRREKGHLASFRYLMDVMRHWPSLEGYDVVQIINPHFLSLRPGRLAYFLREIQKKNGNLFLTLCGNDYFYVKHCVDEGFRFSEFRVGTERTPFSVACPEREKGWLRDDVKRYDELVYELVDGAMAVLPEYDMAASPILREKCRFTNIPLDLTRHPFRERDFEGKLDVMIGSKPGMELQKGTAILLDTFKQLASDYPERLSIEKVGGLAYTNYLGRMKKADIIVDQLYAYSPATNALDSMAMGAVAVTGAEPEYFEYIGRKDNSPVIRVSPLIKNLKDKIMEILSGPEHLRKMSREARDIVEKNNDVRIVADKFIRQWNEMSH